jgi:alpha-glucosidase
MTRATHEAQASYAPDERVFTVTRRAAGNQRYAQTWSGDNTTSWDTLRWNLRMGLTMSLSGMFNTGHDVGGFSGPTPDPELLVRWVQSGAFSPRFIMNSWKEGGEVNTPWLHPKVLPIVRNWIRLRYRLLPYLYTLYSRAARFAEPMLRPRFYDYPGDPRAFEDTDDFHVGTNLLVASIVEARSARASCLTCPRGRASGSISGPATSIEPARRSWRRAPRCIPLFVPAGAIVPVTDTADMRRKRRTLARAASVPGPWPRRERLHDL